MQRFVLRLVLCAAAVLGASSLLPQYIAASSVEGALLFAVVLGLLNAFLRPVLLLLTLPLTIVTLGLFTLVINALVFWTATLLPPGGVGVRVNGFPGAFAGALVVSAASFVASRALR